MTDTNPVFRLTINLPAQRYLFDEDDVTGMLIKLEDGHVMFRPAHNQQSADSVTLTKRSRGGFEATIDGTMSSQLLDAFMGCATLAKPFFRMVKDKSGWIGISHFKGEGAPSKIIPHMRVWPPRDRIDIVYPHPVTDAISTMLGGFVHLVRVSKHVLTEHEHERRVGRPTKEVFEAREVMMAFETLADEIIPIRSSLQESMKPIQTAVDLLSTYITSNTPRTEVASRLLESVVRAGLEQSDVVAETPIKHTGEHVTGLMAGMRTVFAPATTDAEAVAPVKRGPGRPKIQRSATEAAEIKHLTKLRAKARMQEKAQAIKNTHAGTYTYAEMKQGLQESVVAKAHTVSRTEPVGLVEDTMVAVAETVAVDATPILAMIADIEPVVQETVAETDDLVREIDPDFVEYDTEQGAPLDVAHPGVAIRKVSPKFWKGATRKVGNVRRQA